MRHNYHFMGNLTCGQYKTQNVFVKLILDFEDDDPFAPPAPKGKYHKGFLCEGQFTVEWPTSVPVYYRKLLEADLTIRDQDDSTKLEIVLVDYVRSEPGLPGALPGHPCRTKHLTWSFICLKAPVADGLESFPEVMKRAAMKVFVFSRFPGFWNSTQTSAVVTAMNRYQAIEVLNRKMTEKGIAPLQEGGYSLVELDITQTNAIILADGSD